MVIQRIEVYLDGASKPLAVLERPPFRIELDATSLAEGPHALKVVTFYQDGTVRQRDFTFEVSHAGRIRASALGEAPLRGRVEIDLTEEEETAPSSSPPSLWLYLALPVALFLLLVGGVWALEAMGNTPISSQSAAASTAPAILSTLPSGKEVYEANCAACHQGNGKGVPGVFPALVGNEKLADAKYVVTTILNGRGGMPSFAHLKDEEIATVATYVRNSWGNAFGSVSPEEVRALRR